MDQINAVGGTSTVTKSASGFAALDQGDFLRLLTVQIQQQDPFDPVDNKEMLAQMAQFSTLAGTTEMGATLSSIAEKLDQLIALNSSSPAADDADDQAG